MILSLFQGKYYIKIDYEPKGLVLDSDRLCFEGIDIRIELIIVELFQIKLKRTESSLKYQNQAKMV